MVKRSIIGIILFCSLFVSVGAYGGITIKPEPGMAPETVQMVQKVVATFNNIVNKNMKTYLARNVQLFLCPTEESYAEILRTKFKFSRKLAKQSAVNSVGMSSSNLAVTAIKFDLHSKQSVKYRAYSVTAHELAHQLQADLSGNYMGRTLYWMCEGTADLIAAVVAAENGYESFDKWKLDRFNILRGSKEYVAPDIINYISFQEWNKLVEEEKYPYEVSDLLVFYLKTVTEKDFYEAMAEYYCQASNFKDDALVFSEVFGISIEEFNKNAAEWLKQNITSDTRMEVIADGQNEAVRDFQTAFDLSQSLLKEKFSENLKSHQRIILAPDQSYYITSIINEFGTTQSEAEQWATKWTWRFSNGTTVLELGDHSTREKRYYRTANIMIKKFLSQEAPSRLISNHYWFRYGIADWFGAFVIERAEIAQTSNYRDLWLASLREAQSRPRLTEIKTSKQWNTAREKYGNKVTESLAALASIYLVETKQTAAITNWLQETRELSNSQTAFSKVFGMTFEDFSTKFEEYLQINLK
ncbi:MAG: hypothetical protein ACM3YE_09120 [Bacteroidota bacterium]